MARLLVHVEGETEESFVNEVLAPHLYSLGYQSVGARLLGTARERDRRGGIIAWATARRDIIRHLHQDGGCIATTMVDFYGLPQGEQKCWPHRGTAGRLPFPEKALTIESAMLAEVHAELGDDFNTTRFVPYIVMHEFEGLLFSDPARFASGVGQPSLQTEFQAISDQFDSPEHINDSLQTAPSKRVTALFPDYEKPLLGTLAVLEIGLQPIREKCPFFNQWVARLEALATVQF